MAKIYNNSSSDFEISRVKTLQEERVRIQARTFVKWINSFITKAGMSINDLFSDLADGRKLLKLLEIISGEKLGQPNYGKMRVHFVENLNKSLAFLHTKIRLESVGAEDIADGNRILILGLVWTIILRFQIQEIEVDFKDGVDDKSTRKTAREALLLWCQRITAGYRNVNIVDFSSSWRNGLAFNAIVHYHRPDLIDFNGLNVNEHILNLTIAFNLAENELDIPSLLDPIDMDTEKPDERSVLTYVSLYYHKFSNTKSGQSQEKLPDDIPPCAISQIHKEIDKQVKQSDQKPNYEKSTADLLSWIQQQMRMLDDWDFSENLDKVQRELVNFKKFREVEKPPKFKEKVEIEQNFDGRAIQDLQRAWKRLESSEHWRGVALRDELNKQTQIWNDWLKKSGV